jgi:hypothetical protein
VDHAGYKTGRGMYFPENQHVFKDNFHGSGLLEEAMRSILKRGYKLETFCMLRPSTRPKAKLLCAKCNQASFRKCPRLAYPRYLFGCTSGDPKEITSFSHKHRERKQKTH